MQGRKLRGTLGYELKNLEWGCKISRRFSEDTAQNSPEHVISSEMFFGGGGARPLPKPLPSWETIFDPNQAL